MMGARLHDVARCLAVLTLAAGLSGRADAQDSVQANNPIGSLTSFNLQNQFIGNLSTVDEHANILNFRLIQPFTIGESTSISRTTVPLTTQPVGPGFDQRTGLGDTNVFAARLFDTGNPRVTFGIGPSLTMPTATDTRLGGEKWNLGIANVLFNANSPRVQFGYLLVYEQSIAGDDDRPDAERAFFQPFGIYQLGDGWVLRSTGVWQYDFKTDNYATPVGLGVGKVVPYERTVANFFFEPQYSVWRDGPGQPEWGVFFGINLQLLR
ncbi:hypothetical protein ACVDG3_17480 [Meridianimarinicoccus sp. RP-17]|uniref:hypothetical protein n=1 Tax=Meridianimarinicoccus zhengii TaxID=2056810 RepID=UPI001C9B12F8|nr:hypothetical protein [Phycocomes zhengii]